MSQTWTDAVFLHWESDPSAAARWLPPGTELDLWADRALVGLIALRIDAAVLGVAPVPLHGSMTEINVRLYSLERGGRRGVVFCSQDVDRLVPALAGRGYGLPYAWSRNTATHQDRIVSYSGARRWPGEGHPTTAFSVQIADPLVSPSDLEHFLTARWVLHWFRFRRRFWSAIEHEPWKLCRADLLTFKDELIQAAGLPPPEGAPVSALYSPGLRARIGPPRLAD